MRTHRARAEKRKMWMLTVEFFKLKNFPPKKKNWKNNECMHITNATNFNDAKLTNFENKKNFEKEAQLWS